MSGVDEIDRIDPEELREAARRLLEDKVDRRAPWGDGAGDGGAALLQEMRLLGWHLLTLPDALGGLGQDFVALTPIYEELGGALSPVTMAGTMAALDLLAGDDSAAGRDLLARIADGAAQVVIAELDHAGDFVTACVATIAGATQASDLLIVPASGAGGCALVDLTGAGVTVVPVETWDRGRGFADIALSAARTAPLAVNGHEAMLRARAHGDLALAWDSLGGARRALLEAVAYMGMRQQFGRPIGSFQALKHRAADLKVMLEVARALAVHASAAYASGSGPWSDLAAQARILAGDSYHAITEDSVQMHGGVGFTWEFDCHLFLKRALMNEMLGTTPEKLRDRVAKGIFERALASG